MWRALLGKLGTSFQGDLLVAFLAWVTLASLVADLFTRRKATRLLTTITFAVVATGLTVYGGLAGYWWIGVLVALATILVRGRWRKVFFFFISTLWKITFHYGLDAERVRVAMSDRWANVTTQKL
jgi:hypothetical protein